MKSVADTDNDSENYLPAEIPAAIETFIKKQYPNARLVEIEVEHGMTEVDIIDGNISKEIVFNSSNEWDIYFLGRTPQRTTGNSDPCDRFFREICGISNR